ncbi:cytochrome c-type biogenesis protein CcmE homolog, mitochondrial-like, partial [Macadamia integrifolia]|uniref:cytochrome c-type biogenesis protein CcmE homolog, mitochondrial-like n=1 Tax=Macadamia integrifolia TaxID=60698 RepID=UPI001C4EED90
APTEARFSGQVICFSLFPSFSPSRDLENFQWLPGFACDLDLVFVALSAILCRSGLPFFAIIESPLLITSPSANLSIAPVELPFSTAGFRYLLTLRRQPVPKRTVDIGARARQLQNRRLWTYALYFQLRCRFHCDCHKQFPGPVGLLCHPNRCHGEVSGKPIEEQVQVKWIACRRKRHSARSGMEFVITDLITDILVRYEVSLPDLFREGHSAIVEGFVRLFTDETREELSSAGKHVSAKARSGDCYFAAAEVLAKQD